MTLGQVLESASTKQQTLSSPFGAVTAVVMQVCILSFLSLTDYQTSTPEEYFASCHKINVVLSFQLNIFWNDT